MHFFMPTQLPSMLLFFFPLSLSWGFLGFLFDSSFSKGKKKKQKTQNNKFYSGVDSRRRSEVVEMETQFSTDCRQASLAADTATLVD